MPFLLKKNSFAPLAERLVAGAEITPDELAPVGRPEMAAQARDLLNHCIRKGAPMASLQTLVGTGMQILEQGPTFGGPLATAFEAERPDVFEMLWQHVVSELQTGWHNWTLSSLATELAAGGWAAQVQKILSLRRPGCAMDCRANNLRCVCYDVSSWMNVAIAGAIRGNYCHLVRDMMPPAPIPCDSALYTAVRNGSLRAIRDLVEEVGMSIKDSHVLYQTTLAYAVGDNYVDIVEYIRSSTDVDPMPNYWNKSVLVGLEMLVRNVFPDSIVCEQMLRLCASVAPLLLVTQVICAICEHEELFDIVRQLDVAFYNPTEAARVICQYARWPAFEWAAPRLSVEMGAEHVRDALRNRDSAVLAHLVNDLGLPLPEDAVAVAQQGLSGAALSFLADRGLHLELTDDLWRVWRGHAERGLAPAAYERWARGSISEGRFHLAPSADLRGRYLPSAARRELSRARFHTIIVHDGVHLDALVHWLPSASPALDTLITPPLTAGKLARLEPALARSAVRQLLMAHDPAMAPAQFATVHPQPVALAGRQAIWAAGPWSPDVHARYPPELRAIIVALFVLARSRPNLCRNWQVGLLARAIGHLNWWA